MEEVSHSRLALFRSCRKKYYFKYIQKLQPKETAPEMVIGSLVHDAFDMLYKGKSHQDILAYINDKANEHIAQADINSQEDLLIAKYTAVAMYAGNPWIALKSKIIHSEKEFSVTVGKMRNVRLVGRIDRVCEIGSTHAIRELKTTGLTQRQFANKIRKAIQPTTYLYALNKSGFKDIECVVYDVIMRHRLRKRVNETADEFGKRIYADYTDPKKTEFYYQQPRVYRTAEELTLFEKDCADTIKTLRDMNKCKSYYRNPDECFNFNKECPYYKICFKKEDPILNNIFYNKGGN